jgi:hypothetical protein
MLSRSIPFSGCVATHLGELKLAFLPRPFGKCYFVLSMGVNLISLGYINRCGGTYSSSPKLTLTVSTAPGVSVQSNMGPNNYNFTASIDKPYIITNFSTKC